MSLIGQLAVRGAKGVGRVAEIAALGTGICVAINVIDKRDGRVSLTLPAMVTNGVTGMMKCCCDKLFIKESDGFCIPAGTKTLLGEDIADLAEVDGSGLANGAGFGMTCLSWLRNQSITKLVSGEVVPGETVTEYFQNHDTETLKAYCDMSEEQRAAYEIMLVCKKYAGKVETQGCDTAFEQKMNEYKTYCETNGIDYEKCLRMASNELQAESAVHKTRSYDAIGIPILHMCSVNDAAYQSATCNCAHMMLLGYAGQHVPEFQDETSIVVGQQGLSYQDTLDTDFVFKPTRGVQSLFEKASKIAGTTFGAAWGWVDETAHVADEQMKAQGIDNGPVWTDTAEDIGRLITSGDIASDYQAACEKDNDTQFY